MSVFLKYGDRQPYRAFDVPTTPDLRQLLDTYPLAQTTTVTIGPLKALDGV